ncbi:MAG: 50S ribosomal protein L21e [Candidatus Nanohaloarchaea archaeon]|nr:50S ribosomal protein L21e [Candidatus Nanohaloarchaea archaeon]
MVQKSNGTRNHTRKKLTRSGGTGGEIADRLEDFDEGDQVRIELDPTVQEGMPHPRFHGKTGTVVEDSGRNYRVEIRDGGKTKQLVSNTAHLEPAE